MAASGVNAALPRHSFFVAPPNKRRRLFITTITVLPVEGLAEGKVTVPDYLWAKLGEALTGRYDIQLLKPVLGELPPEVDRSPYRTIQVGTPGGTTTLYITEVENLSPEEQRARLEVVEQLLGEELGPAARRALEQARRVLKNSGAMATVERPDGSGPHGRCRFAAPSSDRALVNAHHRLLE